METRVLIRSGPKPYAANPPPQWCSRWNLITIGQLVSEIFMFESVDTRTDGRTRGRTPARVSYYKLTLSLQLWWSNKTIPKMCMLFSETRGQFNNGSVRGHSLFWYLSLFIMRKVWHHYKRLRALASMNSTQILSIRCLPLSTTVLCVCEPWQEFNLS